MRDRLIEVMKKTVVGVENGHIVLAETIWLPRVFEAMADRLLANGVIVPPCKVGQKVWFLYVNLDEVIEATVVKIAYNHFTSPQEWITIEYVSPVIGKHSYTSRVDLMLGKTVFLTREEAEKALAERSEG